MVVIGGMHHILGPALGVLFYILFRELFSIWTANWLLWFGLVFVGFVLYLAERPGRHLGHAAPPLAPAAGGGGRHEQAQDLRGPAAAGLPAPAGDARNACSRSNAVSKQFGGIRAVTNASLTVGAGEIHALIGPERRRQDHLVQSGVRACSRRTRGTVRLNGREIHGAAGAQHLPAGHRPLVPDHQPVPQSHRSTRTCACRCRRGIRRASMPGATSTAIREIHAETAELIRFLGLEGIEEIEGGELSYGGQRLVDLGIALGSKPQVLLLDEPLAGLAAAERERVSSLVKSVAAQHPGADRRARHRPRARLLAAGHRDEPGRGADGGHAGRGARRPPRAGGLHRHRHAARHRPRRRRRQPTRRCCGSRASTPSTARATSSTTRRSTCAKARSSRCSAATARASPRC